MPARWRTGALAGILAAVTIDAALQVLSGFQRFGMRPGLDTTRALAAVTTGETVFRETPLPGAIFTRVAASHIRVGTFEYAAALRDEPTDGVDPQSRNAIFELLEARNRQEKLAAMGRVSAGIAHEIRNPLTAIAQANALLAEDCAQDPRLEPLTRMVASNVERLKRLVDDVMEVAPGIAPVALTLTVAPLLREYAADWAATQRLPEGEASPLRLELGSETSTVSFDPEHLRRILINLLDNGLRHAHPGPATLRVQQTEEGDWVRLSVFSRADPIPAEVERHLFEPFFSTRSRGSGLGLYICRELCERYGGSIAYHRVETGPAAGANEFRVLLPRPASPAAVLASIPSPGPDSHFPDTELHER